MKNFFIKALIITVRLAIGGIFIASSIPKLRQPYDFLASVYGFELVNPSIGVAVAIVLPWLELFVGICLLGGILVPGALLVTIGTSAMFVFAIASALWRGLEISCGCFNPADSGIIGYWTLVRTIALLAAAMAAYICMISTHTTKKTIYETACGKHKDL